MGKLFNTQMIVAVIIGGLLLSMVIAPMMAGNGNGNGNGNGVQPAE